ncbi:hypothetical protein ACFVHB_33705 [Kitasatospora sp. NPDC127111]|uniref:hypothetical protein n=1 Tax=Kitasatospora sp. NPDC127111 TaxID=3345363 RepID=UPI00363DCCB6
MSGWQLVQGGTLVGELHEEGCDMPWFLHRFVPGPGWEGVRELFERLAAVRWGDGPEGKQFAAAVLPIRAAELRLVAVGFDEPDLTVWRGPCFLHIEGDSARLRYAAADGRR